MATAEENRALIKRFYAAFGQMEGAVMAACYAPDATFEDPAFGELHGADIGSMWRMLTGRASDLKVELPSHDADESTGTANWIASYTFSTGNHVVNDIQARFRFENGLIADHRDDFDFRRWARQALGPMGLLVATIPPLRSKARKKAIEQLAEFKASEGSEASGAGA